MYDRTQKELGDRDTERLDGAWEVIVRAGRVCCVCVTMRCLFIYGKTTNDYSSGGGVLKIPET